MSTLMMGFQIMLVLMFFTGMEVEGSYINRCDEMMRFNEDIDSFMKLENTEILKLLCANATLYFKCFKDGLYQHTGFTIKEMANFLKGTESAEYLNSLVIMEKTVKKMCRNGNQIQSGLDMDFPCFERGRMIPVKHCYNQTALGYLAFIDLQPAKELSEANNECIIRAYQQGCVAATLCEECGVKTLKRYKTVIKKTGFFRNGTCSSNLKETLKTTFLGLDMKKSRKNVYRAILDLRKRRK